MLARWRGRMQIRQGSLVAKPRMTLWYGWRSRPLRASLLLLHVSPETDPGWSSGLVDNLAIVKRPTITALPTISGRFCIFFPHVRSPLTELSPHTIDADGSRARLVSAVPRLGAPVA